MQVRWAAGASRAGAAARRDPEAAATGPRSTPAQKTYTAEAATGLGRFGTVRPLDPPHTQPNFVMREMGYQVARRHAAQASRHGGDAAVSAAARRRCCCC